MGEPDLAAAGGRSLSDEEVRMRVARLEELLDRLERLPGAAPDLAMEAIETLTQVYGTAMSRMVAMVAAGSAGLTAFAEDEVVAHLMLLHGLHPDPAERRVARVLEEVRDQLGGQVEVALTGIDEGVARLRVTASGCASTAASTASAVRDAVLAAAPELVDVEPETARPPALIPVDSLLHRPGRP